MTNAEIQVGEYVRTIDGYIHKIEYAEEFYQDSVDVGIGIIPEVDGIWVDKEHFSYIEKSKIANHDFNIIKLIEAGDYVNGIEVEAIDYDEDENGKLFDVLGLVYVDDDYAYRKELKDINIYSIVTKEQFKSMEYEVVK